MIKKTRKELIEIIAQLNKKLDARDSKPSRDIEDKDGRSKRKRRANNVITERLSAEQAGKQVEEALRRSDELNRSIAQTAVDAIISINSDGIIFLWNNAAEKIFGYSTSEMMNQDLSIIIPDKYKAGHHAGIKRLKIGGKEKLLGKTIEIIALRKDGTEFPVELSLSSWETDDQKYYTGIIRDITERKQVEEALRKSEERFDLSVRSTLDGIWDWNILTNEEYFAPRWCEIVGYSHDDPELPHNYNSWASKIHPDDYERVMDALKAHLEEGKTYNVDYRHRHKSGEYRWQNSNGQAIFDENGKPVRMVGCIRDITERKKAEEELLKLNSAIEQSPASVVITDLDGTIQYVNPNFTKVTGYSYEEAIGQNPRILKSGEHNEEFYKNMWETLTSGKIWEGELVDRKKNGELYWESASISPILNENGEIINFVAVKTDITGRKKAEKELLVAKEEAEAATLAKSDFLARMSHEIRTPMNAIIGMTHLTLQTELEKKQKENLKKVHSSGISLLGIINDILDFSKIEAGKLDLEHSEFDLEKAFHDLANVITYKAHEKGLELVIGLPHSVPRMLIGDPLRLSQILINLSNNAIKFTRDGEIVIQAELVEKKKGKVNIRFSIRDTGIGLTKKQAGRLFQSFSQADVSTTRKYGGTGLGLSICKSLTEMMEGEIWVESKKGSGSTFFFTAWFGLGKEQKAKEFVPAVNLRGTKILVCDDNEASCYILKEALKTFTFNVKTVNSGKDAIVELEKNADEPYELVLMDWNMPEMDGFQTAELIKSDKNIVAPPTIIMVTAYNREEVLSKAEKNGISATLIKPVSYSTLFDTIMGVFGKEVEREHTAREAVIPEDLLSKLHGALVLLVEDNEVNQDVAVGMLETAGINADIANNGKEAVEMVKASGKPSKYELVFMDLQMPEMDGYNATRVIRKLKDYKDLPIAAMTADAIAGVKEKCLEAGMNDFITKPIDPLEFYKALVKWIKPGTAKTGKKTGSKIASETELHVEIPEIEGIDIKDGLRRINNNKTLYLKLMAKFSKNYSGFIQELKGKLLEGSSEKAEHLVHTIKGVSGNIGATDLHNYAVMLNDKLRKQEKIDINNELSQFEKHLNPILESLEKFHKKKEEELSDDPKDTVEILDKSILTDRLKELGELLKNSDFDAVEKLKVIEKISGIGQYRKELRKTNDFISSYEFDEAEKVVFKWIKGI